MPTLKLVGLVLLAALPASAADGPKPLLELKLEKIKELKLQKPLQKGRAPVVSSASGLVKKGDTFFVVADDDSAIFSFKLQDTFVKAHPLSNKELPVDFSLRKKMKPDYEALAELTKKQWPPNGALLAWPSGSTGQRKHAVVLPFENGGGFSKPISLPLKKLFAALEKSTQQINIEGLIINDQNLILFQRGNSADAKSGVFKISFKDWLRSSVKKSGRKVKPSFTEINLGRLKDVKLTLADGISTPHGTIGIATAENTQSSYDDGAIMGSVLVKINDDKATSIGGFASAVKLEGMAIGDIDENNATFFFVDDADNPVKASSLYKIEVPISVLK